MKTSFYFVLWTLIYPILSLFDNPAINSNSFLIALIIVFILSRLIDKLIPNIISYDIISKINEILEYAYTNNIKALKKQLYRRTAIEIIVSVYFAITILVLLLAIKNGYGNQWIGLIVFGILLYGSVAQSIKFNKAYSQIDNDTSHEGLIEIIKNTYQLDYNAYSNIRDNNSFDEMFPSRPKFYTLFAIFSLIIAIICIILGVFHLFNGIIIEISVSAEAVSSMYILYGSLALYFGIKDIIECCHTLKFRPKKNK